MLSQQIRHTLVARRFRPVQRRNAPFGLGVDIGTVGKQQLRHVLMPTNRRPVQWPIEKSLTGKPETGLQLMLDGD
jgi:hypothetical protein